jgi:hypothetical protein
MHPNLKPLPLSLLSNLGKTHRQDQLANGLAAFPQPVTNLRQHRTGLYTVRVVSQGLDLMMECTNPEAEEAQRQWGLHSFTLHTAASGRPHAWAFAWPEGLEPDTATASDVARLFSAPDDETMLVTPTMTCGLLPGLDGQVWSMLCAFDGNSQLLQNLTLVRMGEWRALQPATA